MQDLSIFTHLPQISSQPPGIRWTIDPKLDQYIQQLANVPVDAIAYHLVTTDPSPTVNACLTAFLAHIAFVPTYRLRATHLLLQQYYSEDITDLYQLGLEIISEPRKFLSNFDVSRSIDTGYWYPNLYRWSQQKFDLRLIDKIRSQTGMSSFRRTNLGLVVRATPTKTMKALTQQGYPVTTHPTYLALQSCLEKAVKARRFDTANPQPAHYGEILDLYRQRQVTPLDVESIVSYLDRLGSALSNYDRLRVSSIDLPTSEDGNRPVVDTISGSENPLDTVILTEYQQQVDRLKDTMTDLLQQLPINKDRLLMLIDGLGLTQVEAGKELNFDPTTAFKQRKKILASLAQNIYLQFSARLPSPPLSSERLDFIVTQVIAFCRQYYPDLLLEISQKFGSQDRQLLIEQICSRWQLQLQPTSATIVKLTKIINQSPLP